MEFDKRKVFWWSPKPFLGLKIFQKQNVGDFLGPMLVQKILQTQGLNINDIKKEKLLSIGSVLHFANDNDTVWGSGVNGKVNPDFHKFKTLDIRAVRGPLTGEFLKKRGLIDPEVYGDPGILVADYWKRSRPVEKNKIVFIPHMRDKVNLGNNIKILSPLTEFETFLTEIQTAEKVISSSLHGVIIAESYGIPAVLFENHSGETAFKYEDYYRGTGRETFKAYSDINAAFKADPAVPDFSTVKRKLLAKFPWDIWA
ncbi:polysaccharide pyruvyl transferase family protein [Methylobacillus flagellatus]|uniref:polysaccharide pyruvyl transferase family protein n=1 Tax=Methylobacillus flagellatus TaxID=405 RepID=UPI002853A919|nr:polysaccharide pyruvyl transferase family protein [Methylobacillus flagellatus]MDR5172635.1 polysaccharide pyruvyl transferase family protein [Methylobacillus flagellatus]